MSPVRPNPTRIACIGGSACFTLEQIGARDRLVGWTEDASPSLLRDSGVLLGNPKEPDFGKLAKLQPELVLVDRFLCSGEAFAALSSEFPVYVLDATSLLDLRLELEELGSMLHMTDEFRAKSLELQAHELRIRSEQLGAPPLRLLIPLSREPWSIVGGKGFAADCLAVCAAKTAINNSENRSEPWIPGQLRPEDYDALILPTPSFTQEDGDVLAVAPELADKPMRLLDERALLWAGLYALQGLQEICKVVHSLRHDLPG
ncbi:MAG: hypothetical protein CSA62_02845 [Planctomycetota bacterium]|nr:MAG: hypothetical protein CSA62_02845 [Planctomycetota bacterium]